MTIEEFLEHCKARGWHFTHSWVLRRLKELTDELRPVR